MYRLGIDIGGTKINIGLLDENNHLLGNHKLWIKDIQKLAESVNEAVNLLCTRLNITTKEIVSCGIGVPGTVSSAGRKLIKAPNIQILSENVVEEIEQALQVPAAMVQDSRAAAWGEYLCGAGQGATSVVCITLGTGIGTGMVLDGKIYNGSLGSAGELGHLPVCENGRPCGCGKNGCLEKYCAGGGLDITAREILGEGHTASDLFAAAENGHEEAAAQINHAVELLGNAIVAIVNLLSPDCILFSGGLSEQEALYLQPIMNYVKNLVTTVERCRN